jgi:methyl-accepting chemotaxis protein
MSIKPLRDAVLYSLPFFLLGLLIAFGDQATGFSVPIVGGVMGVVCGITLFIVVLGLKNKIQVYAYQQEALLKVINEKEDGAQGAVKSLTEEQDKNSHLQKSIVNFSNFAGKSVQQSIAWLESVSATSDVLQSSVREMKTKASLYRSELVIASDKVMEAMKMADNMMEVNEKVNNALILIPEITAQINLVALNATIEATRAGEVGKGFSVVASEVKKLAMETFEVTQNITEFLGEGHSSALQANQLVSNMVDVMHDAKRMIEDIMQIISEHDENLEDMRGVMGSLVACINDVKRKISSLAIVPPSETQHSI